MGSRLKDLVYISIIVFLGFGVWSSYNKESRSVENEWNWSENDHGQVVDMEENLLQIDGHVEGSDYDHIVGNEAVDENAQVPFDIHDTFNNQDLQEGDELHLPREDDIVHGESYLGESNEDQVEYGNQQNVLLQQQAQLNAPAPVGPLGSVGQPVSNQASLVAAAQQILQNHADKANTVNTDDSNTDTGVAANSPHVQPAEEKLKPKLVFRSKSVRDASKDNSGTPKIPKIIHQSWESTDIPMNFAKWVSSWLEKNPGWEYWFWTPEDVQALLEKSYPSYVHTLDESVSLENRANIMRYFIIHAHGGVYAELDMECLNNIDTWIFSHGCFLAEEAREHSYLVHNILTGSVINAIMACRPHHPFYEVILHALPDYLQRYPTEPMRASGSFFLDEIFRAFKKHPLPPSLVHYGDVALIEPDYFIPSYDQKHWSAIDKACNTNIGDMPFHVSWLCTLWIRKRMRENQPYKHSYTDHHWMDASELGPGNIVTIPISTIIQSVIAGGGLPDIQQEVEPPKGDVLVGGQPVASDIGSLQQAAPPANAQPPLPLANIQQPALPASVQQPLPLAKVEEVAPSASVQQAAPPASAQQAALPAVASLPAQNVNAPLQNDPQQYQNVQGAPAYQQQIQQQYAAQNQQQLPNLPQQQQQQQQAPGQEGVIQPGEDFSKYHPVVRSDVRQIPMANAPTNARNPV